MVKVIPMEKKEKDELIKNRGVAFYCRVGTASQTEAEREQIKLEKKLFKTLINYTQGYYSNATELEKKAYNKKVYQLKARILGDVEHAPDIIAEEFALYQRNMYRAQMTGYYSTVKCDAEWKAIDNVYMAFIDAKPFKPTKK